MDIHDIHNISTTCTRTEFVGTAVLDTIGLVISGVDDSLLQQMNVGTKYHCLGLFSSRTGAAGQITAIDDAVKATQKCFPLNFQEIRKAGADTETTLYLAEMTYPMYATPFQWPWN